MAKTAKVLLVENSTVLKVISLSLDIPKLILALSNIGIKSISSYLVQTQKHCIFHTKLYEEDGTGVSQCRAIAALDIVSRELYLT